MSAKAVAAIRAVAADRDDQAQRHQELMYALVAREPCTVMGRRARFTVEWLDEVPFGKTPEEFRLWAADRLAEMRRVELRGEHGPELRSGVPGQRLTDVRVPPPAGAQASDGIMEEWAR